MFSVYLTIGTENLCTIFDLLNSLNTMYAFGRLFHLFYPVKCLRNMLLLWAQLVKHKFYALAVVI